MAFVTDFLDDGRVRAWTLSAGGGATATTREYAPRFYVGVRGRRDGDGRLRGGADDRGTFLDLRAHYEAHPDVVGTTFVHERTSFGRPPERLLAVDATHVDRVRSLARQAHEVAPTGEFACYDVDLSPVRSYARWVLRATATGGAVFVLSPTVAPLLIERLQGVERDGFGLDAALDRLVDRLDEVVPE